jgi:hypothetical protein
MKTKGNKMEECKNCRRMFWNGFFLGLIAVLLFFAVVGALTSCSTLPKEETECTDEVQEIEDLYTELEQCGEVEECEVDTGTGEEAETDNYTEVDTAEDTEEDIGQIVTTEECESAILLEKIKTMQDEINKLRYNNIQSTISYEMCMIRLDDCKSKP